MTRRRWRNFSSSLLTSSGKRGVVARGPGVAPSKAALFGPGGEVDSKGKKKKKGKKQPIDSEKRPDW